MGSLFNPQVVNSTTYSDQLAISLGLFQDRLIGETADHFLDRLYSAAYSRRDHTLEGTVNDIAFQLGLAVQAGISIVCDDQTTIVQVSAGQITFTPTTGGSLSIATVTIALDNIWEWRLMSDVVADINSLSNGTITATLLIPDGLAIQIAPQISSGCSVAEAISGTDVQLKYSGVATASILFNHTVPSFTLDADGSLVFSSALNAGITASYMYNLSPFYLAVSPVAVISLMDPALQITAVCNDGSLVYQMREFNQQILAMDPCYWGK